MRNPFASALWRDPSFVRVWTAASISIFGSLITRLALPFAAILVLGSGVLPPHIGEMEIDPIEASRAAHLEQPPGV